MRAAGTSDVATSERATVATYASYGEAQKAVDLLADHGFPVEKTAIVAQDLRFVEEVLGRRRLISAAVEAMFTGAGIGALVGFLLGFLSLFEPVVSGTVLALWGLLLGAVTGVLLGLVGHGLSLGHRDFASVGAFHASRFDIVVDPDVAAGAAKYLREVRRLVAPKR